MMGITQLFVLSTRTMQWFEERGTHAQTYLHDDPFPDLSVLSCPVLSSPLNIYQYMIYLLSSPLISSTQHHLFFPIFSFCTHLFTFIHPLILPHLISSPLFLLIFSTQQDLFFLTLHCSHPRENIIPQEGPRST